MPSNKNATIRYQTLDRCFSDFRHRYYIDDLIEACNKALFEFSGKDTVSRSTIFADITYMESEQGWSIPLERLKDGKRTYYRYESRDFSINKKELTEDELAQLRTTIMALSRYRGLPANEWLEEVLANLEYRFNVKPHSANFLSFEQNQNLRGIQFLSMLIDATGNHQTLRVKYRNFDGIEFDWIIYPYFLKQYNNRWFLFGMNEEFATISNIPLDRIEAVETTELQFKHNDSVDFETYFNDIIGVTVPSPEVEKQTIRLKFDKKRFPYIVSKPIHQSQRVLSETDGIIEIDVRPNKELESLIMSYGPQVEILSPTDMRQQFSEKIEENFKKYFPSR